MIIIWQSDGRPLLDLCRAFVQVDGKVGGGHLTRDVPAATPVAFIMAVVAPLRAAGRYYLFPFYYRHFQKHLNSTGN